MLLDYLQHRSDCKRKQSERASKIATLPKPYLYPLSPSERAILGKPIGELVQDVQKTVTSPVDILRAYGKAAIKAQEKTNCLTEILFPEAEEWIERGEVNLKGPLAGIPVSLKDSIVVKGFDASVGYSCNTGKPYADDGIMVKLLKDAGAVPFVKTNLPTTLLSFESSNDVWGRCTNPHNPKYSPGGSTGGESALLACGGSRIGIGSDVAGSVRVPAHFSGCYSLRCSTGRWPKGGVNTSMPGQEGVASVYSPMARTLDDLTYFTRALIQFKPWRYDYSVHPLAWRDDMYSDYSTAQPLRIGILRSDGVVDPTPACARALSMAASALAAKGHEIIELTPPPAPYSPADALVLASALLNSDGCLTFSSFFRTGESNDPGAAQISFYSALPKPIKYLHYLWLKHVRRDPLWAELLYALGPKTAAEQWKLVAKREILRAEWFKWWDQQTADVDPATGKLGRPVDVLLTVPNATPATPHGGMKDAVSSCGYTFLFNILDWTAGVMPVTKVNGVTDEMGQEWRKQGLNGVARGAYKLYDAKAMEGLPVGVQVVGRRLEEEKVLAVMERVEDALAEAGNRYELLEVD